jgi:hypothetical protein
MATTLDFVEYICEQITGTALFVIEKISVNIWSM